MGSMARGAKDGWRAVYSGLAGEIEIWKRRPRERRGRSWRTACCVALIGIVCVAAAVRMEADAARASGVMPCGATPQVSPDGVPLPTTVATIAQAYFCLMAHDPDAQAHDDDLLLRGAMAGLVADLIGQGRDQPEAVMPALSGDQGADWRAFSQTYQSVAARLPRDTRTQSRLAQVTIAGMVESLQDDHTRYAPPQQTESKGASRAPSGPAGPGGFGIGLRLSADENLPARTAAPLFALAIDAGSPAARAGLRPGDIITAINGHPPFVQGLVDQAVLAQVDRPVALSLRLLRPSSGRVWAVTMTPASYPSPEPVMARVLEGDIAYIRLASFPDNAANFVIAALDGLGLGTHLRGVVLDLRGNGGGSAEEPARLLGAFVHHKIVGYLEDGHGHRVAEWSDARIPLIHAPLVVLVDRGCASACDVTASAMRDLHLGRLVGERTAGDAAGPARTWYLDDGSVLQITVGFMRGADGEIVDGIGVPPDDAAPETAAALSAGRDPGIDRALRDLAWENQHHA